MKPILTFVEGRLRPVEKPRTMRRAASRLVERLTGSARSAAHVMVMFADHPSSIVMDLVATLQHRLPGVEIDMAPVSAVVGGHTGPGLLGCAVRWHDDA
jgi:fatty acid-binding protein DegV